MSANFAILSYWVERSDIYRWQWEIFQYEPPEWRDKPPRADFLDRGRLGYAGPDFATAKGEFLLERTQRLALAGIVVMQRGGSR